MELYELVVVVSPTAYILGISMIVCLDISPKGLAQPFPAVADMFKGEREKKKRTQFLLFSAMPGRTKLLQIWTRGYTSAVLVAF